MVYVDNIKIHEVFGHTGWCHLLADNINELHEFANKIGLQIDWFQAGSCPHYDLTTSKRTRAIKKGAIPIEGKELVKIIHNWHGWKNK